MGMNTFYSFLHFGHVEEDVADCCMVDITRLNSKATFVQQADVKYLISTVAPCTQPFVFVLGFFSPRFLEAFAQLCYNISLCKQTGIVGVAVEHQWMVSQF